ncbi:hypothetical protein Tco_1168020, partial [Tanacetum coccineum]
WVSWWGGRAPSSPSLAPSLNLDTYAGKKYVNQIYEMRFLVIEARISKEDGTWITPTLRGESLTQNKIKYVVTMSGIMLDDCTYGRDIKGLLLTLHGDNGEIKSCYTSKVSRRFRHSQANFDSLAKGKLIVSVKGKGYHNPKSQNE